MVRLRKVATRPGRPASLEDGYTLEGQQVEEPVPGIPYAIRPGARDKGAVDIFVTTSVRAVIREAGQPVVLLTDNSEYRIEEIR